jgi:hypothetical protein
MDKRTRCECWSRVSGYFRPITNFNKGKLSEHINRKHFTEVAVSNHLFNEQYKLCDSQPN